MSSAQHNPKRSTVKSIVSYNASLKKTSHKQRDGKQRPILQTARQPTVHVIYEGEDVTPFYLNPYLYEGNKERQIANLDTLTKENSFTVHHSSMNRVDSQKFQTNVLMQKQEVETATMTHHSIVTSTYLVDDLVIPPVSMMSKGSYSEDVVEEDADLVEVIKPPIPEHLSLLLGETETIFLLDIASCTVARTSEEADDAEEDNKQYDYITKGKGKNRKMIAVAVQTVPLLSKARNTETEKIRNKHCQTYVSGWEMFDTFQDVDHKADDKSSVSILSDEEDSYAMVDLHRLNEEGSLDSYRMALEEKQLLKIVRSKTFLDALLVIERILGSNSYNAQQKRFKGLSDPDVFREDIEYQYRLEPLWIYANETTNGRCVTALAFNSFNEDIVAVAYGKYFYNDRDCSGMVMVWNIKNPQQPERQYDFLVPVTSVAFSKHFPYLLAIGFYNGRLQIQDVSKREVEAVREITSFFEPVWSIVWFQQEDEEHIMASFGDGKVCRLQITGAPELKATQIMLTAAAEGTLKGIQYLKKCESKSISIIGYEQARCLTLHPTDSYTYFVGTDEGVVHRCSTNYYNEHMDLFKAHDGAIHTIRFSPFANKFFYTCGDDFRVRLWVDGISEPLVTSESSILPILDVDWSPEHPTVSATIRGPTILVWDLQRKVHASQSVRKSPDNVFYTVCRFSPNGRCLLVGDMIGNVHVFSLEDMPIPPFFPENLIAQSVKKLLVTKPELLKKFKKLGALNFAKKQHSKYFN